MQSSRCWGLAVALACGASLVACGSDSHKADAPSGGEGGEASAGAPTASLPEGGANEGGAAGAAAAAHEGGTPGAGASNEGGAPSAGGSSDSSAGETGRAGAGGAPEPCTGGPRCLSDTIAAICTDSGELETFECTDGCVDAACARTNLQTGWLLHQYALSDDSTEIDASYSFSDNGLSALQTTNAQPSIYYLDRELESVVISGSFAVETTSDDDLIGFVFGLQDTEHFYLFDWKQTAQADASCGNAAVGATLRVVSGEAPLTTCKDFWDSTSTTAMTVLVPATENPAAWLDNTLYTFTLQHRPGHIAITVKNGDETVVSLTSNDDTYTSGRFGFYNYSQEQSRYQFFDIQPSD